MAKKKNTGPVFATVFDGNMIIREAPDFNSAALGYVDNGATVEVLEVKGQWARIREGYVLDRYLKKIPTTIEETK